MPLPSVPAKEDWPLEEALEDSSGDDNSWLEETAEDSSVDDDSLLEEGSLDSSAVDSDDPKDSESSSSLDSSLDKTSEDSLLLCEELLEDWSLAMLEDGLEEDSRGKDRDASVEEFFVPQDSNKAAVAKVNKAFIP